MDRREYAECFQKLVDCFVKEEKFIQDIELMDKEVNEIDNTLDSLTVYGDGQEWRVEQLRDMLKEEGYEVEKSWKK